MTDLMQKVTPEFKKCLRSFAGCDGGNLKDIWVFGLEWGDPIDKDRGELDLTPVESATEWTWDEENCGYIEPYNEKLIWFISYFYGFDLDKESIKELALNHKIISAEKDSIGFKGNLFPIRFRNRHSTEWTDELKTKTGLDSFSEYRQVVIYERGEFFRKLIEENKPKFILCTGLGETASFIQALTDQVKYKIDIKDGIKICYADYKGCKVFVVPFFGYYYHCINKKEKMASLVNRIKALL
ncbi:hypothetical protein [Lonepinella sp. BR2930]|uniref:hypothetical protein n=1 Tax=Lonepinella sp. BR2930 TaxID=3434554 RepID=UPI003F6DB5EA